MTLRAAALAVLAGALLFWPADVRAKDMGSLYSDATLKHWEPRYRKSVLWNVENVILPKLTKQERRKLAKVRYEFPLRGIGNDPLAFYAASGAKPRVVLPILSIKAFDDMSVALAWLQLKGYSLATAYDYVAMMKYRDAAFFGGRYPPPLEALRIPKNALDDSEVDSLSQKILKSAIVFIVAHELGHVLHGHPGYGPGVARAEARENEAEADAFAIEVLRRIGVVPGGMIFYFQTLAHGSPNRGDFASDVDYEAYLAKATHPLTEDRMRRLAKALLVRPADFAKEYEDESQGVQAIRFIADQLGQVADILADRDMQRHISEIGRKTPLSALAPRRAGETIGLPADSSLTEGTLEPFHGVYDGEFTLNGAPVAIRLILRRKGRRVSGQYGYGQGAGTLVGRVEGDTLVFEWREGGTTGRGRFQIADDGERFSGSWGLAASAENGGSWTGTRVRQ